MTIHGAKNLPIDPVAVATDRATHAGSTLTPSFRVSLRHRHDDTAVVETVIMKARTIASARHAARLSHPDRVILSVTRV